MQFHDDTSLPCGVLCLHHKGGHGSHNGYEKRCFAYLIIELLKRQYFIEFLFSYYMQKKKNILWWMGTWFAFACVFSVLEMVYESLRLLNLWYVWTRIFHVCPYSIGETRFLFVKNNFWKSRSRHLFYFYFKGKIKQERKTLKCDSIIFGKSMSLKNPSLSLGIRLLIGKVPLGGSTPLSPIKVSTNKVKGSVAINQLIMDT